MNMVQIEFAFVYKTMSTSNNTPIVLPNGRTLQLLEDNRDWTNRFQIPSSSGENLYTIAQRKGGQQGWACSCPGWIRWHSKPGFTGCKHLQSLSGVLKQLEARKQAPRLG